VTRLYRALRALLATWRGRFILAFLLLQLALPLHYYVLRDDVHDERWAWRMFSPMRMTKCRSTWTVDRQPVALGSQFHEAWLEMVERGRLVVIQEMAHRLCRKHPGKPVEVTLQCTYFDRPPATYGSFDLCTETLR
jgi:hypothetical protein